MSSIVKVTTKLDHLNDFCIFVEESPKFQKWIKQAIIYNEVEIKSFDLTDVNFFGKPSSKTLGFYKGFAEVYDLIIRRKIEKINDKSELERLTKLEKIPINICFNRGDAVACIVIVKNTDTKKKYVLLARQVRTPALRYLVEAIAGMVDTDTGNLSGVMLKELKEEANITLNKNDLIDLGENIYPSSGGSDESIKLFAYETEMNDIDFQLKISKFFGVDNENIHLIAIPYEDFDNYLDIIGDVKAECAWRRYQRKIKSLNNKSICCNIV